MINRGSNWKTVNWLCTALSFSLRCTSLFASRIKQSPRTELLEHFEATTIRKIARKNDREIYRRSANERIDEKKMVCWKHRNKSATRTILEHENEEEQQNTAMTGVVVRPSVQMKRNKD
ncbi:hypothetical protein QE152_g4957 [Popillia japonica]|uniref:Secreted protein n=1 Tax=Popillia japonica TaxID=7064 RepID=A0AAW1MQT3_POPJA